MKNQIHETAIIDHNVILGENNVIGPYCHITGETVIGNNNIFQSHCVVGSQAEHRDYMRLESGKTIIGDNNIFREFVTIHAGTSGVTTIKNNVIMLRGSHIGHDSLVSDKANLSCNVLIGGHSYIMEGVNFGLGSICHQFSVIGAYSMIGMGSVVTKSSKIEPGNIYVGIPVRFLKQNQIGIERNKISAERLSVLLSEYENLYNHSRG